MKYTFARDLVDQVTVTQLYQGEQLTFNHIGSILSLGVETPFPKRASDLPDINT